MQNWHVYMIRCGDGSLYTGITTDVSRRFSEHQKQGKTGAKYLKGRGHLTLVFQQMIGEKSMALKREREIKKLSKVKKEDLIKNHDKQS